MAIRQLQTDDRAVSPVIGTILMVAVTVILAAIIGTFMLDLGDGVSASPTASFGFDQDGAAGETNATVSVTHQGGDTLDADKIEVRVDGNASSTQFTSDVAAGSTIDVDISGYTADQEITVVWTSEESGKSAVLGRYIIN